MLNTIATTTKRILITVTKILYIYLHIYMHTHTYIRTDARGILPHTAINTVDASL